MIYRDFQDEEKEGGLLGGALGEMLGEVGDEDEDEDGVKPVVEEEDGDDKWEGGGLKDRMIFNGGMAHTVENHAVFSLKLETATFRGWFLEYVIVNRSVEFLS